MGESSYIEESLKQEIDAKISGGYFDPLDRLMDFLGKNMEAKCMEELAELIKAISKISVGGYFKKDLENDLKANLIEEIADVQICIEMILCKYELTRDDIQTAINQKMKINMQKIDDTI